jgi:flagellar biosynthesis protein FliR
MTGDDAALLATLPAWAFAFVLIMARIGSAIALLPGLGEADRPRCCASGLPSG